MAQEWDIKARADRCGKCEQLFDDGQVYVSGLARGEDGFIRGDYHEECWKELADENTPFSVWRAVFRSPPPPEEEAVRKETAESLLRKLMEDDDESQASVMFVLAVMLERKRILKEVAVEEPEDGRVLRIYEHKGTRESFLIPEPFLKLDELEAVQQSVVALLSGEAEKPGAEEAEC